MTTLPEPSYSRQSDHKTKQAVADEFGLDTVYRMSYNESILGASPQAVAAIQRAATNLGDYPLFSDGVLRNALAETWGRGLTPEHFHTGCSGYETIELVYRAFLRPGDELIQSSPTFGMYPKVAAMQGAKTVDVPLLLPDFQVDIDGILAAITPNTRIVMLCNPNNPTGTVMPAAEMDRLVKGVPEHVIIVSDEVYCHFVDSAEYPDTIAYILEGRSFISTQSFSKAYGLAGLRLGYAMAPPHISNHISGLQRGFHQNRLALAGGVAALHDQAHMQANVKAALDGKAWLYAQCDRLGLSYVPSQTNFFVLRMPGHLAAGDVAKNLLKDGVMVRPLGGPGLENTLRISIGPSAGNELFIKGLERELAG